MKHCITKSEKKKRRPKGRIRPKGRTRPLCDNWDAEPLSCEPLHFCFFNYGKDNGGPTRAGHESSLSYKRVKEPLVFNRLTSYGQREGIDEKKVVKDEVRSEGKW